MQNDFSAIYNPSVISIFPEITIEKLDGYEEIYRKLIEQVSPTTTLSGWRTRVFAFAAENAAGKAQLIAELLERLIESREAICIVDHGGLLEDQGAFQSTIRNVLDRVGLQRRPYLIFIADRMVPHALQRQIEGIVYCRLPPLSPDETKQLVALKLREADINYSADELDSWWTCATDTLSMLRF